MRSPSATARAFVANAPSGNVAAKSPAWIASPPRATLIRLMWSLLAACACWRRRRSPAVKPLAPSACVYHARLVSSATAPNDRKPTSSPWGFGHRQGRRSGPGQQPRADGSHDSGDPQAQELRAVDLRHPPLSSCIGYS